MAALVDDNLQINNYITKMRAGGITVPIHRGGGSVVSVLDASYTGPRRVAVPNAVVPQAAARYLQVRLITHQTIPEAAGIVFYWYNWHPTKKVNGKSCQDQDEDAKNKALAGFVYDAATFVRNHYGSQNRAILRIAEVNREDKADWIRWQLVDVEKQNAQGNWVIDWDTTRFKLHEKLMREYIPVWFYNPRPSTTIPWPGVQQGNGWECNQRKCG